MSTSIEVKWEVTFIVANTESNLPVCFQQEEWYYHPVIELKTELVTVNLRLANFLGTVAS